MDKKKQLDKILKKKSDKDLKNRYTEILYEEFSD